MSFVPLISTFFATLCDLDILFLKPEGSNPIISQTGDIDNRIKTLFDALRVPKFYQEISGLKPPAPDEDPFFCLLEDDSLITGFNVIGDRLPIPPTTTSHWNNYAVLIIDVKIKLVRSIPLNQAFLG